MCLWWITLKTLERRIFGVVGVCGGIDCDGVEEKFGPGTAEFLKEANKRQTYMKTELLRRYGLVATKEGEKDSS